jgi:hypothetical protein
MTQDDTDRYRDRCVELQRERDRYRAALEQVAGIDAHNSASGRAQEVARGALAWRQDG